MAGLLTCSCSWQALKLFLVWDAEGISETQDTVVQQLFEAIDADSDSSDGEGDGKKVSKKDKKKRKKRSSKSSESVETVSSSSSSSSKDASHMTCGHASMHCTISQDPVHVG